MKPRKSSANYPQSNGRANSLSSRARECSEAILMQMAKVTKALLQYRNTPILGLGWSLSYMLLGRQIRDALPSSPTTSNLKGDSVAIQNRSGKHPLRWDRTGIIVERLRIGRTWSRQMAQGGYCSERKIDPVTRHSPRTDSC